MSKRPGPGEKRVKADWKCLLLLFFYVHNISSSRKGAAEVGRRGEKGVIVGGVCVPEGLDKKE